MRKFKNSNLPWWTNPAMVMVFLTLPLYLIASQSLGAAQLSGAQGVNDYLSYELVLLGAGSIAVLVLGSILGSSVSLPGTPVSGLNAKSVERALRVLGYVAAVAYIIFFVPLLSDPSLILVFISGERGSSSSLQETLERVPGITSFIQFTIPFLTLYSGYRISMGRKYPRDIVALYYLLIVFTVFRGFLASERLALIEVVAAIWLPRIALSKKKSLIRSGLPYFGLLFVFLLFSVAEFFRSWGYYKDVYSNFLDFSVNRFFAYFSTSINNGAALVKLYSAYNTNFTYEFLGKIPLLNLKMDVDPVMEAYLQQYGNPEFNNPGGLFVPYVDFGYGGVLVFLAAGFFCGIFYAGFARRQIVSLMLYPAWIIGVFDILRIFYWGSTRFFPILIGTFVALLIVRKISVKSVGTRSV